MKYDPFKHQRRSIRLRGYDYSRPGAYFVTICLHGNQCLLGHIVDSDMMVNAAGTMVYDEWLALSNRFRNIKLDAFVVMPNHVHGIIQIQDRDVGAGLVPAQGDRPDPNAGVNTVDVPGTRAPIKDAPTGNETDVGVPLVGTLNGDESDRPTLGEIVGVFKSLTTHGYIQGVRDHGWPSFHTRLWQRNYYEHIIRNEQTLNAIRVYVKSNPANWMEDELNPSSQTRRNL